MIRAAGGIVARDGRILVVHRPKYDDWTLPKGKAEEGESDEDCAVREVEEETSLRCELGPEVAVTHYDDAYGRPKQARYFAMTPPAGAEPAAANEIDEVRWVTLDEARALLSYERDRKVIAKL